MFIDFVECEFIEKVNVCAWIHHHFHFVAFEINKAMWVILTVSHSEYVCIFKVFFGWDLFYWFAGFRTADTTPMVCFPQEWQVWPLAGHVFACGNAPPQFRQMELFCFSDFWRVWQLARDCKLIIITTSITLDRHIGQKNMVCLVAQAPRSSRMSHFYAFFLFFIITL